MAEKIDIAKLRAAILPSAVIGHSVKLEKKGDEHLGLCPFHNEGTPSFTVNDDKDGGFFHCFGCGAHGDIFDFIQKRDNVTLGEAIKRVAGMAGVDASAPPEREQPAGKAAKAQWEPVHPIPAGAPEPPASHSRHGKAATVWAYRAADGAMLGYICRFNLPDGHKEVLPLTWCRCTKAGHSYIKTDGSGGGKKVNVGDFAWQWLSFAKPRPLYGLDELAKRPDAQVVIGEGEKCKDALQRLFPDAVAVSWPGGGKAVKFVDWSPLRGRKAAIWPDADLHQYPVTHARAGQVMPPIEQEGMKTAFAIAEAVAPIAAGLRIACPPAGKPDGWDAADAEADGWTPDQALEWLRGAIREPAQLRAELAMNEDTAADDAPLPMGDMGYGGDEGAPTDADMGEFTCLGYDHGRYFYLPRGAQQVIELTGAGHTKSNLQMLAPLHYWEREFPTKGGANWDQAANALLRMSERAGPYDPMRIRGRGAWWDDGHAILHLGNRLVIDGREMRLTDGQSEFIYEAAPPIRLRTADPLRTTELEPLIDLCGMLTWERPIYAKLMLGWVVVAIICGAMKWRPHIWITGKAGTGKSWVYQNLLARLLGNIALKLASSTTEPGVRRSLGSDARPVVFDEADGETAKAQANIQNVLGLMRQSSSETDAVIAKGAMGGAGVDLFQPRSSFAFCSIGVGIKQHADATRISVLSLQSMPQFTKADRDAAARHFEEIERLYLATVTDEFVDRLHARVIKLIPMIRKNAETFARAGQKVVGTRRFGDQVGALLAGCYALHSSNEITLDNAVAWVQQQDWSEEAQPSGEKDEVGCLQRILQTVVGVQTAHQRVDRSLGDLAVIVHKDSDEDTVSVETARAALARHGLIVKEGWLLVSNTHSAIARILRDQPWADNWGRTLKRLENEATNEKADAGGTHRFGSGPAQRSTMVPMSLISD